MEVRRAQPAKQVALMPGERRSRSEPHGGDMTASAGVTEGQTAQPARGAKRVARAPKGTPLLQRWLQHPEALIHPKHHPTILQHRLNYRDHWLKALPGMPSYSLPPRERGITPLDQHAGGVELTMLTQKYRSLVKGGQHHPAVRIDIEVTICAAGVIGEHVIVTPRGADKPFIDVPCLSVS